MSTEIVVLHSSPPHQQRDTGTITTPPSLQYVPNSSASDNSSLPSISKLWTKWDPKIKGASKASPLPLDLRLKGVSKPGSLPENANIGFRSVKGVVGLKELGIEEEIVEEVQVQSSTGGKAKVVKEFGNEIKAKKPRATAKTKSKTEEDDGTIKEAKPKGKRKSKAKAAIVDTEDIVSSHFSRKNEVEKAEDPAKEAKPKAKRKSRAKIVVSSHFDQTLRVEEHGTSDTVKKITAPATKKRKRKDTDGAEEGKPKAVRRVSKDDNTKVLKPRNKTGHASTHFPTGDIPEGSKNVEIEKATTDVAEPSEPLGFAEKRRRSWTPAKDTAQFQPDGDNTYEVPSSSQPPTPISVKTDFCNLIGSFGFDGPSTTRSVSPGKAAVVGMNKRRRIELIKDTTVVSGESKPNAPGPADAKAAVVKEVKKKLTKKAAFSITAKVMAKYGQPAIVSTETTSVLFAPRVEAPAKEASAEKQASPLKKAPRARPKGPTKPRASKKATEEGAKVVKSKAKVTKPKKVVPGGQKLLSPLGIASKAQQQVVIFGTSSQLLTGDSPNALRHLQQALRESELMMTVQEEPTSTAPVQRRLARGIRHTSGKMWAQQAKSSNEDPVDADKLLSPTVVRELELPAIAEPLEDNSGSPSTKVTSVDSMFHHFTDDVFQTLSDEIEAMGSLESPREVENPSNQEPVAGGFMSGQPIPEEEASDWNIISSPLGSPVGSPRIESRHSPSPFTRTITLSSKRTAVAPAMRSSLFIPPPPLSDRAALRSLSTNTKSSKKTIATHKDPAKSTNIVTANTAESPKKKRGRPPKAKTSDNLDKDKPSKAALVLQSTPIKAPKAQDIADTWHTLDEIMDSEPDMTPSPRRRGKKAPPSPLPDLVTTTTEAVTKRVNGVLTNANHPQWPEIQSELFPDITLAVKGQLRSEGGQKLTWYEKMLLYDPIVIEDLTAFVNGEGLRIKVKEKDEEVRGWMVQKWCEENSVCCLWKEGLRGGVKTKY